MNRKEQTVTVTSNFAADTEGVIDVVQFPDGVPIAHVVIGFGQTVNTGNYSSMRYDVQVSIPTFAEEVDEAFNYARAIVEERAAELRAQIKTATGK